MWLRHSCWTRFSIQVFKFRFSIQVFKFRFASTILVIAFHNNQVIKVHFNIENLQIYSPCLPLCMVSREHVALSNVPYICWSLLSAQILAGKSQDFSQKTRKNTAHELGYRSPPRGAFYEKKTMVWLAAAINIGNRGTNRIVSVTQDQCF